MRRAMPMFSRLWPARCLLCDLYVAQANTPLCQGCHDDLPWSQTPVYQHHDVTVFTGFDYDWPIDRLIHLFKYQARIDLLPVLLHGLKQHAAPAVDALVAVPMSQQRLRERGFNHAQLMTNALSQHWQIPTWHGLVRTRHTLRQQSLDRLDRLDNLNNAFAVTDTPPARLMIVDDVMTTGSTLHTLTTLLAHHGSTHLQAAVFAHVHAKRHSA